MSSSFPETSLVYKSAAPPAVNIDRLMTDGLASLSAHSVEASYDLGKSQLAKQVRLLITYVGQEGSLKDLEVWIRGLDGEKLIAFAESSQGRLPFELSVLFLEDGRKKIRDTVELSNQDDDLNLDQWVKKSRNELNLSKKQVIGQGRKAVVEILVDAYMSGRVLTDDEKETIKNMALNIPDEKVIDNILIFAEDDRKIAIELSCNDALTSKHINRLIDIALGKAAEDKKWDTVISELIVHQHLKLGENTKFDRETVEKLMDTPTASTFLKVELSNASTPEKKTAVKKKKVGSRKKVIRRRQAKAKKHAKKQSRWNELSLSDEEASRRLTAQYHEQFRKVQ